MTGKIVDFRDTDFDNMCIRELDNLNFDKEKMKGIGTSYPTYTYLVDEEPAAVFGVVPMSTTSAEIWSITSDTIDEHPIAYVRWSKHVIKQTMDSMGLVRLQAVCLVIHDISKRWLESLGFNVEGIMRKYDSKQNDYYMMARII